MADDTPVTRYELDLVLDPLRRDIREIKDDIHSIADSQWLGPQGRTFMAGAGVTSFYELGAGKVLSGLVKRIADTAVGIAVGSPADVKMLQAGRSALDAAI